MLMRFIKGFILISTLVTLVGAATLWLRKNRKKYIENMGRNEHMENERKKSYQHGVESDGSGQCNWS